MTSSPSATDVDVAIIGAGWAGLAAAVNATQAGHKVALFDSAPQAGGRARKSTVRFAPRCEVNLDNGQHLLIGAYKECVALINKVGGQTLQRSSMRLQSTSGLDIASIAPTGILKLLPASFLRGLGFCLAKGLTVSDKVSISAMLARLQWSKWQAKSEAQSVSNLLKEFKQSDSVQKNFWLPLCMATMNTPAETADAATFCRVLRDSLGSADHDASDFLTPLTHLGAAFPDAALHWLGQCAGNSCAIYLRTTVLSLLRSRSLWALNNNVHARHVIIALPPSNTARLLESVRDQTAPVLPAPALHLTLAGQTAIDMLNGFNYLPIATVYLAWRSHQTLPSMLMLNDDRASGSPGQWLFSRGLHQTEIGSVTIAAIVISAWDSTATGLDSNQALADAVKRQVSFEANLPMADYATVIVEKRATFACTAGRPRFNAQSLKKEPAFENIWLAGDYCYSDYPATLEGAVRSGIAAASQIKA